MQNLTYFPISCWPDYLWECVLAYWLYRTIPFILLIIGTLGNIINIYILTRPKLSQHSTSVFLTVLAVADLITLWTDLVPRVVNVMITTPLENQSEAICRLRLMVSLSAGEVVVWIIVAITVERLMLIKYPVTSKPKFTPRKAKIACVVLVTIIVLTNIHIIVGFGHIPLAGFAMRSMNVTTNRTSLTNTVCAFTSTTYARFYVSYFTPLLLLTCIVIPAVIVVLGNIYIIKHIVRQKHRMNRIKPTMVSTLRRSVTAEDVQKRPVRLLFVLSFMCLITAIPYFTYWIIRERVVIKTREQIAQCQLLTVIVFIILWLNSAFNFFLYVANGSLFRKEWNKIIQRFLFKTSVSND